jgi:hypothetical protein
MYWSPAFALHACCEFLVHAAVPAGARIGESFDRHLGQPSASSSRARLPFTPAESQPIDISLRYEG